MINRSCPLRRTQRRFEADFRAAASIGCPPRWNDYSVASISKHPGAFLQERERLVQRETAPGRVVCSHPSPDRGINPRGISQRQQQIFLEVPAERPGSISPVPWMKTPILVQAQLERGIMPGSNEKVQLPIIDIGG